MSLQAWRLQLYFHIWYFNIWFFAISKNLSYKLGSITNKETSLAFQDETRNGTELLEICLNSSKTDGCTEWIIVKQKPNFIDNGNEVFRQIMLDMNSSFKVFLKESGGKITHSKTVHFLAPYKPTDLKFEEICGSTLGSFLILT